MLPLYARLQWDGRHGRAVCGAVEVELHAPPPVCGGPAEIDYSEAHPGKYVCPPEIRPLAYDKRREMELHEIELVRGWLRGLLAVYARYLKEK